MKSYEIVKTLKYKYLKFIFHEELSIVRCYCDGLYCYRFNNWRGNH